MEIILAVVGMIIGFVVGRFSKKTKSSKSRSNGTGASSTGSGEGERHRN